MTHPTTRRAAPRAPASARLLCCLCLLGADAAQASVFDETQGVRAAAMGNASRAIGTSNETIFMNPAGMALLKRYTVEAQYAYNKLDRLSRADVSIVDSKYSPVAGGLSYSHVRGDEGGVEPSIHRVYASAAYPITTRFAFGMTARHIRGEYNDASGERQKVDTYSGDFGIIASLPLGISLGAAYSNLSKSKVPEFTPGGLGFGVAFNLRMLVLGADMTMRMDDGDAHRRSYHFGGEAFLGQSYAFRAGYRRSPFVSRAGDWKTENVLSAGFGIVSGGGSIDVCYVGSLSRQRNGSVIAALKFFM